jgi:hypothetical protein
MFELKTIPQWLTVFAVTMLSLSAAREAALALARGIFRPYRLLISLSRCEIGSDMNLPQSGSVTAAGSVTGSQAALPLTRRVTL